MDKNKTIKLSFDEYSELKRYAMALQAIVDMVLRGLDDRGKADQVEIALSHLKNQMKKSKLL